MAVERSVARSDLGSVGTVKISPVVSFVSFMNGGMGGEGSA